MTRIAQAAMAAVVLIFFSQHRADAKDQTIIDDALSPGKTGQIFCSAPNIKQKTCQSAATYSFRPDGKIDTETQFILNINPRIEMSVKSLIYPKGKQICGPVLEQDLQAATFLVNGAPTKPQDTARLRQIVKENTFAPTLGQTICVTYVRNAKGLSMISEVNGATIILPYSWVSPDDGYKLGVTTPAQSTQ